ncbi:MAG TPA: hypothetical protein VLE02_01630 [Nitrosarchaeum sp.]|nr:hypothetical protein [Nitrosarchaeum sp.]
MQKNALLALGIFVIFALVVGLCFFIRKKEQYISADSSEEYLDDAGDSDIEIVDTEDVRGFGSGPGLYGSGRHTSESYGGW